MSTLHQHHQQSRLDLPRVRRHTRQQPVATKKLKKVPATARTDSIRNKQTETIAAGQPTSLEIHQERLVEIDKLMKAFDLNYIYGPCVGINRLDRWERAQQLALDPPKRVKEILLNDKTQKYKHSLFHQFRMI
ncbi:MAG: DNA polymerase delta, subunit 4-domain-containing protein [Benjaminiella poitrasii]|nr:MAG: DNA polymerase delta, subunit 4-domain-containing protein [Benjaminiella poitrasii]